jgi:transglutaminase-like putative cysteine protease
VTKQLRRFGGAPLGAFANHAWVEVVLDGRWVAMDPTWNQTQVDATHIRLGVDEQSDLTMRLFGKLKIEVLAVENGG